ncbi:MAG: site-specific integrase [Clostridia bacterium]|nr:site-specific integrase [Clostridia bacterium]
MEEKKTRKKRGERKDGRIQVTYTDGYRKDGKPNRISFYGHSRAEAERKRDEYKAHGPQRVTGDDLTVSEWVEQFKGLYRSKVNPAYLNIDDVPYNRLCKAIGAMVLSSVREADLQDALNQVAGMSESTIDKYNQAIKRVFLRAEKNKLIKSNPATDLIVPDGTKGTHRALDRWETDCILQNWQQHRAGIWAMLMLLAGLRRGEAMALRWENVDMDTRQLTVCEVAVVLKNGTKIEERAKSEAGIRVIPICRPLWDALNQTPKEKRTGLICVSAQGKQNTESSFSRGWDGFNLAMQRILNGEPVNQQGKRVSLEKKIEDAEKRGEVYIVFKTRAHDLRHTFATALFDAGVPAKAAQYYLGHADIRITLDLYTHLSREKERKTRSQLVGFLDGWLKLPAAD